MSSMSKIKASCWVHFIILLAIGFAFWYPAARHLEYWGDNMWHRAFMLAGAARRTILVYHQFPFWNPYMTGGAPLLGNPASSFLSPTFLIVLASGVVTGMKLRILVGLWIGLCGGYYLGRRLAPGRFAPYFCAFIFMLGSWYPLYMSSWHDELIPFVYIPWLLLFFCLGLERTRWCALGGIILALMFFEGGVYPVPYAVLFLVIYALLETLKRRSLVPLRSVALIFIVGLLLSGLKLLPSLELHLLYPRFTYWREPVLQWSAIPRMLWGRDQLSESSFHGAWLGWWEYGMYVGIISLILVLFAAFFLYRRSWNITLVGLVFGSLMFGDYGTFSTWHWIHKLPVFSAMHDPVRFRVLLVLCVSILSATTVSYFERKMERMRSPVFSWLMLFLMLWLTVDLFLVNGEIYAGISSRQPSTPGRGGTFRQKKLPYKDLEALSFLCFLQNEGLVNNYEPLDLPDVGVTAFNEVGYRGEVWLEETKGGVELLKWTPNRLYFRVGVDRPGLLVVNQRYYGGWRSQGGGPVVSKEGLLALRVVPSDSEVCIYYMPRFFYLGCAFSVLGLLLTALVLKDHFF